MYSVGTGFSCTKETGIHIYTCMQICIIQLCAVLFYIENFYLFGSLLNKIREFIACSSFPILGESLSDMLTGSILLSAISISVITVTSVGFNAACLKNFTHITNTGNWC